MIKSSLIIGALIAFISIPTNLNPKKSDSGDGWIEQNLDYSKWALINPSKNAQIDFYSSEEHGGSFVLDIKKEQECFAGVDIDLSNQFSSLTNQIGESEVTGLNFKIFNTISLESTNTIELSLTFVDGQSWTILPTQSWTGIPSLYDIDEEKEIQIDFSSMPSEETYANIASLQFGINGDDSSYMYIYDFKIALSSEVAEQETEHDSVSTIGSYGATFGMYQYGGIFGTSTKLTIVNDDAKSKESDASSLQLSIDGTGSTGGRNYSCYLQLADQVNALSLNKPQSISFWIYNPISFSGGLYFKVGSTELFEGKIHDEEGNELTYTRNLDYVGFRKYTLRLTSEQFTSKELEIGLWGANNDSTIYLSKFTYVDMSRPQVGYKYIGAMNAFSYTSYTDAISFSYETVNNCEYSHNQDLSAVHVSRNEHPETYYSCIYLQKFGQFVQDIAIKKPTLLSIWVYSSAETNSSTGLAFKIKMSDSTITEIYPVNTDRDLDFVGFRNYIIDISKINILDVKEFECAVWGTDAADIYFSDINIFDASFVSETATDYYDIEVDVEKIVPLSSSVTARMSYENQKITFDTYRYNINSNTYIERSLDDVINTHMTSLKICLSSELNYDHSVARLELVYTDETGTEASYIVSSTSFTDVAEAVMIADMTNLPYFLNNTNICKLRICCFGEDAEVKLMVTSLSAKYDDYYVAEPIYTKLICDFDTQSAILDWGISGESSSIYYKELDSEAKIGPGCLNYTFSSMTDSNFSWSEIYYNLNDLVVKNADKNIFGLSFWLFNSHYITAGSFGYWIKVSQTDGMEFEVKFDHIITELETNNNLAFTGWQKIQIPFDSGAYTECDYNPGYSKDSPREFDWTNLQYIKFGFWGSYYNADDGYSAIAKIDDFRFVSGDMIIDDSANFNINFELNGGTLPKGSKTSYTEGESFDLPVPTRPGFKFEGWYSSPSMVGEPITYINSDVRGDLTLYAAWSKDESYGPKLAAIIGGSVGGVALIGLLVFFIIRKKRKV